MNIVWDEPKRQANLIKHGLDFADVVDFDWANAAISPARAGRFGQARMKAIGDFGGIASAVIYAELGVEAISIISFRRASAKERKLYYGQT